ncbi:MAG: peptidoglycan-binding protein [Candidatus Omnitrophica bacterium]|nr:peptidoglycan-binding protein [Candidatus Omnitrophota bacterium]
MSQTKTPAAPQIDPKEIQKALAEAGFYKGTIDGVIGKKSRAAIRAFQEKHGLKADGVCGPKTWEKLKAYLEEAQEMDAVDQELATPTADEGNSLTEDAAMDPWTEPEPEPESSELKQKLVS